MIADQPLTVTWGQPSSFQLNPRMNDNADLSPCAVRVLLVEDSLPVRQRIRSLIEEFGPVEIVGETGTVAGALALFHQHTPDAVVLDLNLADGDGCAVLTAIKRTRPACVVMVLTNFVIPECRDLCLKLGADYFFNKSREFERVPAVLTQLRRRLNSRNA